MAPTDQFHIQTLGRLRISLAEDDLTDRLPQKAKALLVYLGCEPKHYERSYLANLLWDDMPPERALANLRMVISALQQHIASFLDVSRQGLALRQDAAINIDAVDFEWQLSQLQLETRAQQGLLRGEVHKLERVVELYQGDFLAGFSLPSGQAFENWQLRTQDKLRQHMIQALEALVGYALNNQRYRDGISYAQRLIQLDPLVEEHYRQAILLLAYVGQQSQALAHYRTYECILAEELQLAPSSAVRDLVNQIADGTITIRSERLPHHNLPKPLTAFVPRPVEMAEITTRLRHSDARLLTLVGLSGTGKTRLALQAATDHLTYFRDAVYS